MTLVRASSTRDGILPAVAADNFCEGTRGKGLPAVAPGDRRLETRDAAAD